MTQPASPSDFDQAFEKPLPDHGLRSRTAHPSLTGGFQRVLPGCLVLGIGALIVLLVVIVVAIVQWRWVLSGVVAEQINQGILRSALPDEQKQSILTTFETVRRGFVDEQLSYAQLVEAGQTVFVDPGVELGLLYYQREKLTETLELSARDGGALEQALRRLAVGVYQGRVPAEAVLPVLESLYEPQVGGEVGTRQVADPLHLDQIRAVISAATLRADQAGIPLETEPVDVAGRLASRLAEVLGPWQQSLPAGEAAAAKQD